MKHVKKNTENTVYQNETANVDVNTDEPYIQQTKYVQNIMTFVKNNIEIIIKAIFTEKNVFVKIDMITIENENVLRLILHVKANIEKSQNIID